MITVHHLNNSRSQRILWLLEELELPYEIKYYQRNPITMLAPDSLRKIHPLGKSPIITDGDITVAESGAIIEYLLEKTKSNLKPSANTVEARRFTYWLHYAEGSAMPPLLLSLIFSKVAKAPVPFFIKPVTKSISATVMKAFIAPQLKLHFDYMNEELEKYKWFAGNEFTAADIQMSFPIEAAGARGLLKDRKNLEHYLKRIQSRAAYKKALAKGGPYDLLN